MKLGIVTYNIANSWDVPTIISVCEEVGLGGAELRTTHAHGVEVTLSASERGEVKRRFDDSGAEIAGLGSAFDYHSPDPDELRRSIEGTKEYARLAADVGAPGIKVRPNNIPDEVPVEKTLEQIGLSLREVGAFAADCGVEIRLEVHGRKSSHVPYVRQMLDVADHPNVYVCWNSNMTDLADDGTIKPNFDLVADRIGLVHITELWSDYPWAEEFGLLQSVGYEGYTLAEIPGCPDRDSSVRLLKYYRTLWEALCNA